MQNSQFSQTGRPILYSGAIIQMSPDVWFTDRKAPKAFSGLAPHGPAGGA